MIIDQLPALATAGDNDEIAIEVGTTTYKIKKSDFLKEFMPKSGGEFTGDVTVGGVLDVTPRRCSASLSSAGWYRVIIVNNQGSAERSWVANIDITSTYNNTNNAVHSIKLLACYYSFAFVDETSKSNAISVDKIRYVKNDNDSTVCYVDVHYNVSASNGVSVMFSVKTEADRQQYFTASNFTSVAPSPSGETVLAEYTFADNTTINETVQKNSSFGASKFTCYARRRNGIGVVYLNVALPATSSWSETTMGTMTAFKPSINMAFTVNGQGGSTFLVQFYTNGDITIWSPSATAAQFLRGSFVLFVD